MPILIFFMLLFIALGLVWLVGAGLLAATVVSSLPRVFDKVLDYKGKSCACHFPFKHHV
jgi:hypothetical protein